MNDHGGLRWLAGLIVEGDEIVKCGLGDYPEPRAEPERVLETAGDDAVDDANVDHVGEVVTRGGLAGGQADRARIAADNGRDPRTVHLLDFGIAAFRCRLRIAKHRFDLRAAQSLDPAGGVDFVNCHQCADAALLSGVRQCTRDRVQHAQFHRRALRTQHGRRMQECNRGSGRAQSRGVEKPATAQGRKSVRHSFPSVSAKIPE